MLSKTLLKQLQHLCRIIEAEKRTLVRLERLKQLYSMLLQVNKQTFVRLEWPLRTGKRLELQRLDRVYAVATAFLTVLPAATYVRKLAFLTQKHVQHYVLELLNLR